GTEKDYRGTEKDYRGTEKDYRGTEKDYRGTEKDYRGTEKDYRGTEKDYRGTEKDYRGTEKPRVLPTDVLMTPSDPLSSLPGLPPHRRLRSLFCRSRAMLFSLKDTQSCCTEERSSGQEAFADTWSLVSESPRVHAISRQRQVGDSSSSDIRDPAIRDKQRRMKRSFNVDCAGKYVSAAITHNRERKMLGSVSGYKVWELQADLMHRRGSKVERERYSVTQSRRYSQITTSRDPRKPLHLIAFPFTLFTPTPAARAPSLTLKRGYLTGESQYIETDPIFPTARWITGET
ncbi:hypothetical protein KUCAC02_032749, partial [Chaenocephalus aceratus]